MPSTTSTISTLVSLLTPQPLSCTPTFNGVPVSATFLLHQATKTFERAYPGLEISPIFVTDNREPGYSYKETGAFSAYWPTGCVVEVPVFEKLDQAEEARLGIVGIKKTPVAKLILVGDCQYGCAKVTLMEMRLLKLDGEFVWEWKKETNGKK